jgi:hypothetical protein
MQPFSLSGIEIRTSPFALTREQIRFPRTKKKRIQKKWSKDKRNFTDRPGMYLIGSNIAVAHPEIYRKLKNTIDRQAEAYFKKWG